MTPEIIAFLQSQSEPINKVALQAVAKGQNCLTCALYVDLKSGTIEAGPRADLVRHFGERCREFVRKNKPALRQQWLVVVEGLVPEPVFTTVTVWTPNPPPVS